MITNKLLIRRAAGLAYVCATLFLARWGAVQAADPNDACSLLTDAEVASVLGVKVDAGHRPNVEDPHQCYWRAADKPTGIARNLNLYVINVTYFDSGKKAVLRGTESPLPGIGDESYFSSGFVPNLSLRKGSVYLRLMARTNDVGSTEPMSAQNEHDMAAEKTLAALLLKRL